MYGVDEIEALEKAAQEAEQEGDQAHAKALRQTATFKRRQRRESKHGAPHVAVWLQ